MLSKHEKKLRKTAKKKVVYPQRSLPIKIVQQPKFTGNQYLNHVINGGPNIIRDLPPTVSGGNLIIPEEKTLPDCFTQGNSRILVPDRITKSEPLPNTVEVQRDIVVIPPDQQITSDLLTIFEVNRIVGIRADQIERGGVCFVDCDRSNPIKAALTELIMRKCPLLLERKINDWCVEHLDVNKMSIPRDYTSYTPPVSY